MPSIASNIESLTHPANLHVTSTRETSSGPGLGGDVTLHSELLVQLLYGKFSANTSFSH